MLIACLVKRTNLRSMSKATSKPSIGALMCKRSGFTFERGSRPWATCASSQAYLCKPCSLAFFFAGGAGLWGDCKLGWGRDGELPVTQDEAGPAKADECDEQREEVEFYGRVHFKTSWLAKEIINHAGSQAPRVDMLKNPPAGAARVQTRVLP
jgi:hypothetical protein